MKNTKKKNLAAFGLSSDDRDEAVTIDIASSEEEHLHLPCEAEVADHSPVASALARASASTSSSTCPSPSTTVSFAQAGGQGAPAQAPAAAADAAASTAAAPSTATAVDPTPKQQTPYTSPPDPSEAVPQKRKKGDWLATLAAARMKSFSKLSQTDCEKGSKRRGRPPATKANVTATSGQKAAAAAIAAETAERHVQLLQARPPEETGLKPLRQRAKRQRLRAAVPSLAFLEEEKEEAPLPASESTEVDVFMTTAGLAPGSRGSTTIRTSVEELMAYVPVTYVPDVLPISFADHLLNVFLEETKAWHTSKRWLYDRELESHRLESGFRFDDAKGFGPRWERAGFGDDLRHLRSRLANAVREARGKLAASEGGTIGGDRGTPSRFEQAQQVVARASRGQPLRGESAEWLVRYAQDCTQHGWRWEPNYAVANFYEDCEDFLGAHSDPVQSIGPWAIVASLTFGAARQFRMKPVGTLKRRGPDGRPCGERITSFSIRLPHNSLLVCWEGFQEFWRHEVPKDAGLRPHPVAGNGRLNFTFRRTSMAVPRRRPMCHCGRKTMLKPVLKETSRHKGRYFWSCTNPRLKKGQYTSCDFFQWDDERLMEMRNAAAQVQRPPSTTFAGAGPMPTPIQTSATTAAAAAAAAAPQTTAVAAPPANSTSPQTGDSGLATANISSMSAASAAAAVAAALAAEDLATAATATAASAGATTASFPTWSPPGHVSPTPANTFTARAEAPNVTRAMPAAGPAAAGKGRASGSIGGGVEDPKLNLAARSGRVGFGPRQPLASLLPPNPQISKYREELVAGRGKGGKGRGKASLQAAGKGRGRGQASTRGASGGGSGGGGGPSSIEQAARKLTGGASGPTHKAAVHSTRTPAHAQTQRPSETQSTGGLLQRLLSANAKAQPETIDLL